MPVSDCEVLDPRIRRTRQLLQGALRDLLPKRSFDEISVQEIADAATVNRATFYDHYADKFALLDAMVAGGFHQLLHARQIQYDGTCPAAARAVIEATCDYLAQIRAEHPDCGDKSAFEPLIDAAITKAIRGILNGPPDISPIASSPHSDMSRTAASWAIYGAARQWSLSPERIPVAEVVPQILALVFGMLQQASSKTVDTPSLANTVV